MEYWDIENITKLHIEMSTYCNAACPQCKRNIHGGKLNPYLHLRHIDINSLKSAITWPVLTRLDHILLCGSYGDPAMHPQLLEWIQYVKNLRRNLYFVIHTNAGMRSAEWWYELGKTLGDTGEVSFMFDGLEDTNHIYRRGVNWDKAWENAMAYIKGGGRAQWKCIVFKHNEHQIDEIKRRATRFGFDRVDIRRNKRYYNLRDNIYYEKYPILDENMEETGEYLEQPSNPEYAAGPSKRVQTLTNIHGSLREFHENIEPVCESLETNSVYILSDGMVVPCTHFYHLLQDYGANKPVAKDDGDTVLLYKEVQELVKSYGHRDLNIRYNTLPEVMNSDFWKETFRRMNAPDYKHGKLFACAAMCGKCF